MFSCKSVAINFCNGFLRQHTSKVVNKKMVISRGPNVRLMSDKIGWPNQGSRTSWSSSDVTVSRDEKEWAHVEALLPKFTVPEAPETTKRTPSGWIPQCEGKYSKLPYYVARTKNHMMPVYLRQKDGNSRMFTVVKSIEGDIWKLEEELIELLEHKYPKAIPILSQVHEPGRWLRIRGVYTDDVADYLLEKGL